MMLFIMIQAHYHIQGANHAYNYFFSRFSMEVSSYRTFNVYGEYLKKKKKHIVMQLICVTKTHC
jgi:hypothetical protein